MSSLIETTIDVVVTVLITVGFWALVFHGAKREWGWPDEGDSHDTIH